MSHVTRGASRAGRGVETRIGGPRGPKPGHPVGQKNRFSAARVEEELKRIATFDPLALFQRTVDGEGVRFRVRQMQDMPPEARACIARMRVRLERPGKGEPPEQILEIWFWDKVKALELCAKHFGWVSAKTTVVLGADLEKLLAAGRARNAAFHASRQVGRGRTSDRDDPRRALEAGVPDDRVINARPLELNMAPVPRDDEEGEEDDATVVI